MASSIMKMQEKKEIVTESVNVTLPARAGSVSLAAPDKSGYEFLCWLGVASAGSIKLGYIENMFRPSTTIWIEGTASSAINFTAFALYSKGL